MIHTIKGFGIVNKAEIDIFLGLACFSDDPADVGNLISGSSAFSKSSLNIWKFMVHILLKPGLENFEHYFTSVWDECNCAVVWALCHTQVCCTQSSCPCGKPLLTHTSSGDTQTQFWISLHGVSGSWCIQDLFESSKCLWFLWDLILNLISPLLLSCWGFSFALGHVVSNFGGIQNSVDSCSAASCNFGFLTGENEHISFYSTIFLLHLGKV